MALWRYDTNSAFVIKINITLEINTNTSSTDRRESNGDLKTLS